MPELAQGRSPSAPLASPLSPPDPGEDRRAGAAPPVVGAQGLRPYPPGPGALDLLLDWLGNRAEALPVPGGVRLAVTVTAAEFDALAAAGADWEHDEDDDPRECEGDPEPEEFMP